MTRRILLIDDNFDHRFLTRRALRPLELGGHVSVEVAEDGEAALARIRAGPRPDLVLADLKMPRLDGFELLGALRADPSTASLVVIVLTSSENRTDVDRAKVLGANDYLTKPLDAHEFQETVRNKVVAWLDRLP